MTNTATTNTSLTDQELIAQATGGNSDAFGMLVRKYQDKLFTSLNHLAGSRADVEDIVQDAFVQAYLKLGTFRQHCSFYTWLYRIALNILYTRSRQLRVRASLSRTRALHEDDQSDPHGTPVDELERREDAVHIRQALNALSEDHRTILVMRGVDGFDYATIAETLELTAGTVRSRLHRARMEFRDQLQKRQACLLGRCPPAVNQYSSASTKRFSAVGVTRMRFSLFAWTGVAAWAQTYRIQNWRFGDFAASKSIVRQF